MSREPTRHGGVAERGRTFRAWVVLSVAAAATLAAVFEDRVACFSSGIPADPDAYVAGPTPPGPPGPGNHAPSSPEIVPSAVPLADVVFVPPSSRPLAPPESGLTPSFRPPNRIERPPRPRA